MNTEHETKIPEWFTTHPLAEAYRQQKQAETLKRRQAAAEKLESILSEISSGFPEQEASLSSILQDLKEAEKQVAALRAEAGQAYRDLQILKADLDRKKQAVETELYASCDPRLDEAQDFFRNKIDALRQPGTIDSRPMGAERDLVRMNKVVKMETNYNAVNEAMQFCRDAIARLEDLKLCPEYPESEIESLKQGIPPLDIYREYTAERPLPKDGPVTAAAPSDYMLGKLYERADKALRRRR